ncbi:MAG: hypothetical protein ACJAU0_000624 [Flavobacteriales bacterium]|jgi:hypothetical protein
MEVHLKIVGVLLIALSLFHAFFPKHFDWKTQFKDVHLINRQMMYIHTLFLAIGLLLMGVFSCFYADQIISNDLGRVVCAGLALFWFARLLVQFFGYSKTLWKGKKFEMSMHFLFSGVWTYFTVVYGYAAWG